jgi:hypothetical protein
MLLLPLKIQALMLRLQGGLVLVLGRAIDQRSVHGQVLLIGGRGLLCMIGCAMDQQSGWRSGMIL